MPADVLYALAQQSSKKLSKKEVEDYWKKAKKIATDAGRADDYKYIMGIVKKMLKVESLSAQFTSCILIDSVVNGKSPKSALDDLILGHTVQENQILDPHLLDAEVCTYFGSEGELKFSTTENVLLDPSENWIMQEIIEFADSDYPYIIDLLQDYQGSLLNLYEKIRKQYSRSGTQ